MLRSLFPGWLYFTKHFGFIEITHMLVYLNGQFLSDEETKISYNDRGFLLANGIYETIKIHNCTPTFLKNHYDRLKHAGTIIGFPINIQLLELRNIILHLLEKNGLKNQDSSARLTITRGVGPRGLLPPEHPALTIMVTVFASPPRVSGSLSLAISQIRRNEY